MRARGFGVDVEGFETAMERQRAEARAAWAGSGEAATETLWFALRERVGATEFLGYETESAEGVVTALVRDGAEVSTLGAGETGFVILNQTPFYAESGGQVGDVGEMRGASVRVAVRDVKKKLGDVFAHVVEVLEGRLDVGAALELKVDHANRAAIRANHSATHLLHEALRIVLGDHVAQKGSLCRARAAALRFRASEAALARGTRARRGHRQRDRLEGRAGRHAADGARGGPRVGSASAVRRKIRRRGARRLDGDDRGRRQRPAALFDRTLRRHACRAAPAKSGSSR